MAGTTSSGPAAAGSIAPGQRLPVVAVPVPGPQPDGRAGRRRRGKALQEAIYAAVLAEIAESGYAALTMDRIAYRARAGKASLYRRWPGMVQLVMDAAYHEFPGEISVPDTGDLREDLLAVLRLIARQMEGPAGLAVRGLLGESLQNPSVAAEVREHSRGNGVRVIRAIVTRAAARGDVDPVMVTDRRIEAGPALLRDRLIFADGPVTEEFLASTVDEVILRLLGVDGAPK